MPIDEDNDMSVLSYNKYLEDDTKRKKQKITSEFEENGLQFLSEIERKKKRNTLIQIKLIPYILKHCKDIYTEEELKSYSLEDIQDIYNKIKKENRNIFLKFFLFLFNIE